MPVRDLQTHPDPYVTVAELAEYWLVSRKQIYKQIDAGTLPAIRLGPRLLRIRTPDALEFERRAYISSGSAHTEQQYPESEPARGARRAR
jgi:excisionase family DNA binding protein